MPGASLQIELNDKQARRIVDRWKRIVGSGAREAVDQLGTLAERHMKAEAPEGVGIPNVHLRTSIKSKTTSQDPYRKVIQPTKRTDDGWLLHRAIVGNPSTPSYDLDPEAAYPPNVPIWVGPGGDAAGPIAEWASTKLGNPNAAWQIGWNWALGDGQETFPNEFIDESMDKWRGRIDQVANDAVEDAFRTGGGF